jgi:ABC-type hemin transport system substrate-binding protein
MLLHYAPKYAFVSNLSFSLTSIVSPLRIVCLVPSITELVIDMGFAEYLVGRTGFCIHPAQVVGQIPKVGGTKDVNLDKIRALNPTHVIVNVDENPKPVVDALRQWVPHVVVTYPQSAYDNLALIDQLLAAFCPLDTTPNAPNSVAACAIFQKATQLKHQISTQLDALQAITQRPAQQVLYLIWRDPWMTVARDTYISRMLALIGWHTWPAVKGGDGISTPGAGRYPVLSGYEPWLANIDRVLLSSEPYHFTADHLAEVRTWLAGAGAKASVELVDGEMLSWYGSRAVPGLDYLAALSATGCCAGPCGGVSKSSA